MGRSVFDRRLVAVDRAGVSGGRAVETGQAVVEELRDLSGLVPFCYTRAKLVRCRFGES